MSQSSASWFRRNWLVLFGGVLVAISSLVYSQAAGAAPAVGTARAFTAQQLADAVMFAQGPAASRLVGTSRPALTMTAEAKSVRAKVDKAIAQDPAFAESFRLRLQSGDRIKVSAALSDLGKLVRSVLDQVYGSAGVNRQVEQAKAALQRMPSSKSSSLSPNSGTVNVNQTINVNYYYAAAGAYAAVLVIILLVLVCPPCAAPSGSPDGSGKSQLAVDEFVNTVADGFKVA
jgi:SdpC family antimicrobial peptide